MKKSLLWAISLGNILEWYDFGLFTLFSTLFAKLFLPQYDQKVAVLSIFAIFASGFVCRPLGAVLFGHFGDKIGRIRTLRFSILCTALPTLLIACLPTYASMGIASAIALTVLRLFQGVCIGGEFTGIIIYLAESAPKNRRAFYTSFAGTAANIGILAATGIDLLFQHLLTAQQLESFGWRVAFLLGGAFTLLILYMRSKLPDTSVFEQIKKKQHSLQLPIVEVFKKTPFELIRVISLTAAGASLYYTAFVYISTFLFQVTTLAKSTILEIQSICIVSMLLLVPLFGLFCDYFGRKRSMLIISLSALFLALPCFLFLVKGQLMTIILGMAVLTLISSFEQATTTITVVENFPARIRYSGISLGYNIGLAIFGGTAPFIASSLIETTHNPIAPAYYLSFAAMITFLVVIFGLQETKGKSLLE